MTSNADDSVFHIYKRLWSYVTPYRVIGLIAIFSMAATAFVEMIMVALVEPLMDETLVAKNLEASRWLPIAFIGIFVIRGFMGFASEASLGWIGRNVISTLRREVFEKFLTLPISFFEKRKKGSIISKITYNVEMISESVTHVVTILIRDVLTVIAAIALMIYQSPRLFMMVALVLPVIAVLIKFLGSAFRRYSGKIQNSVGEVTQVSEEVLIGNKIVKIFGGNDYEMNRLINIDESNRLQNLKLIRSRSMGVAVTQVIFGIGVSGVIYLAGIEAINSQLSPGSFMSFFGAMMLMLQPVRRITNVNATLQRGVAASRSLFSVIDQPEEIDTGSHVSNSISGSIRFSNVSFSYNKGEKNVLENISFEIKAGKSLAIVGRSGSGKSTIVNLLARFYNLSKGEIFIDDIPIQEYVLSNLRKNISLVNQDVILFNDTISNNLAYGELTNTTTADQLIAAETAHILDFAKEFPNGLETIIGDRGELLSGGQRQRIAIGRAILKDAPILILDEATSSLDSKSERNIQLALDKLMKNCTTLVIAHRLSTVERVDQIIVFHKGRIVEIGNHQELLDKNNHYAELYRIQFNKK
jgi:subfamily B ATP-binding cassette protein MsbA